MRPTFIDSRVVDALHTEVLRRWGGLSGLRDADALAAALARPMNKLAYRESEPDLFALAAAYAYGLSTLHPYTDGNKRTALATCALFLALNGWKVNGGGFAEFKAVVDLVTRSLPEDGFAALLRQWATPEVAARKDG